MYTNPDGTHVSLLIGGLVLMLAGLYALGWSRGINHVCEKACAPYQVVEDDENECSCHSSEPGVKTTVWPKKKK